MNLDRLKAYIDWLVEHPVRELEIVDGDLHVHLAKSATGVVSQQATEPAPETAARPAAARPNSGRVIVAPMYGVVHFSSAQDVADFVSVGQDVTAGQTLCLIEAMKVFSAVEAPTGGRVAEILVAGGSEVTAGQPIFRIEPRQD